MRRYAAFLVVLALLFAACGGATEDTGATTTTADSTTPEESTTTTADSTETTTATETTTSTETTTATEAPTTTAAASSDSSPLAAAIAQSGDATSGRMEGAITVVGAEDMPSGTEISIGFSGAFDSATESSSFVMDLSDAAAGVPGSEEIPAEFADLFGEMEIRTIGDTAYMKFGLFSMFGVTTEWVSMPAEDAGSTASSFGASPTNPTDMLSAFDSDNAEIVEIGREQVRGIDTTHYLMTVDVEAMMAEADAEARAELEDLDGLPGGGMLPVDFWIGDDGNVYRFSFAVDGAADADAGFESMVMLWEMYDYGADVGIVAPPADQVTDGSSLPGFTTS